MKLSAAAIYLSLSAIFTYGANGNSLVKRSAFGLSHHNHIGTNKISLATAHILSSRGGADAVAEEEDAVEEAPVLYLPGLLEANIVSSGTSTAASDSTVSISTKKAAELGVKSGDVVKVIGRRRRFSFATINIGKGRKGCSVSKVLAGNLRLRTGDKMKVVPHSV